MQRWFVPIVIGLGGFVVLVALGVWQVQRLQWKESVLADIGDRITGPPISVPEVPDPATDQFIPVSVNGSFVGDTIRVLASRKIQGAGYRLVTAIESNGRRLLVDRGFAALDGRVLPVADAIEIVGNLHWPDEVDSFTPEPDLSAGIWFARDVQKMASFLNAEPVLVVARSQVPADPNVTPMPVDSSGIPNDHLEYAITWFSLAIVWTAMTAYWMRRNKLRA